MKGKDIQRWILADGKCSDCNAVSDKDVRSSIIKLYYYAKNNVYKESNYYDEMKKIQSRSDFTRSIAVISFVYISLTIILCLILLVDREQENMWIESLKKNINHEFVLTLHPIKFGKTMITFFILFLVFFFSWWAYERESAEYNKRAFGYFSSMLKKDKASKEKSDEKIQILVEGTKVQRENKK